MAIGDSEIIDVECAIIDVAAIDVAIIEQILEDESGEGAIKDQSQAVPNPINPGVDYSKSLLGMKAANWTDIYEIYRKHSQEVGFSIRKGTSRRVDGPGTTEIERNFVCSCEGTHGNTPSRPAVHMVVPPTSTNTLRNAAITRCACKAAIRTQLTEDGQWLVVKHVTEHNHALTPTQWQQHHRSERRITEAEAESIKAMTEAFVAPSVQYKVAAAAAGGDEFVGHTKRDHINFVHRLKIKAIEGGDAATLINMLTKRQSEDPGFFFRVQFNAEGRLHHLFWCDSMMREDYRLYHDVIIFDTTYRTNRYNLICGAFVGINNHWSNVMFGCAFLSDEQEESFKWLFNAFNEAMGEDIRPVSIFTDQDLAMSNAIESVYPESRHRLCQWHIQQNAISHFGTLKHDRAFQKMFNKCLNGCYSEIEFEETWLTMTTEYGIEKHEWFTRLYGLRKKWCTAFNNLYFSAGLLSSQRSESTNHAMGFQASKTTSVTDFFGIFEMTVKRWRGEEERKEFQSIRATPTSVFPLVDLLQHAAQIYTMELFRVFEREFGLAMGTRAAIVQSEDSTFLYRVETVGNEGSSHHVTYDCVNQLTDCTCKKYQVMGMICCHIIRVLHMHSVPEIPSVYIARRWTKFSKTDVWNRLLPADMRRTAANEAINWRRSMLTNVSHLIGKSQKVVEARAIVEQWVATANAEVVLLLQKLSVSTETTTGTSDGPVILDHIRCKTKGRSQRKKRSVGKKKKAKKTNQNEPADGDAYTPIPRLL